MISTKAEQLWTNKNEHESKPEVSIEYTANNDNDEAKEQINESEIPNFN